jgi:hypothetical protein
MSDEDIRRFIAGETDPERFRHADHVGLAYEMLRRDGFMRTLPLYAGGLRRMAERAGRPQVYHETITTAFLSLIGERILMDENPTFDDFAASNRDLLDKSCLLTVYDAGRLNSALARQTFLLPQPKSSTSRTP